MSHNDEEYITSKSMAETTHGPRDCTAHILTASQLYFNSQSESQKYWVQVISNPQDYHSDLMEISSTFRLLEITDWCGQQVEPHWKYTDNLNLAHDIFSPVLNGVRVEANFSLGREVIDCRQSKTTGKTLWEKVVVRQFGGAHNGRLAGHWTALDTTETEQDFKLKKGLEERKLHRMAKVHNFLEMWQGSHNLHATQKEPRIQNKKMTAVG